MQRLQQEFDFHRGDQLGLLRAIRISDGDGVSGTAVKAVLRAIDDYGRECFASMTTLADNANVSDRVVKRAIARLVSLSLITKEKKKNSFGVVTNHYRIVWSEVELFCNRVEVESSCGRPPVDAPVKPQGCQARVSGTAFSGTPVSRSVVETTSTVGPSDQSVGPLATDHWAIRAERWAISDRPLGHDGTQSERSAKDPPRTDACAVVEDGFCSWSPAEHASAMELLGKFLARPKIAIAAAIEASIGPQEIGAICAEFQANRALFHSSGAIVDRIRNGTWPVAGVKSIEEIKAASEAKIVRSRTVDRERIRWQVCEDWKRVGKWSSATDADIEAEVQRRVGT